MEVDRAFVDGGVRPLALDQAEYRAALRFHDREGVRGGRAQTELGGRVIATRPHVAGLRLSQLRQQRCALERLSAERRAVVVIEGRLERCGSDVAVEHARVRVIENRRLHLPVEQRVRLAHEVLVECVLAGDEHCQAMTAPPGSSPLLAQGCHCPRKPDRDRTVEQADVDPELERVRRRDPEQVAFDQSPLDLAPLFGRVARSVRRQPGGGLRVDALCRETVDELGSLAALGKTDRAQAARDEGSQQPRRVAERAGPQSELGVEQLGIPEDDGSLRSSCGVVVDDLRLDPGQRRREVSGIGDRRRREQQLRLGSVHPCQTAEPAQDVADMRAEDAPVDVRFVDDEIAQVVHHIRPAVVVRQHSHVEHVGVREDHVRPFANLPPALCRSVAVVDRRADVRRPELCERARLVLGQGLGRVEVERPSFGLSGDRVQDGQVEAERLPRRRARGEDHVLPAPGCIPRRALMEIELGDGEHFAQARLELVG